MAPRKVPTPSLIEIHNDLSLSTIRRDYLRPASTLNTPTHTVTLETSFSISPSAFTACYELVRDNMQDMYKRSDIGWSASEKKKEMKHPAMRFLLLWRAEKKEEGGEELVKEQEEEEPEWEDEEEGEGEEGQVLGFLSFMVTEEAGHDVVYCYELHLSPGLRGFGLGKHLLSVMEDFGRTTGMEKAMLTCFAKNEGGVRFYNRNGYETDEISPGPKKLRNGVVKEPGYYILSKML